MTRKLFLASAFAALLAGLALPAIDEAAADLIFKPSELLPPAPFNWSGL